MAWTGQMVFGGDLGPGESVGVAGSRRKKHQTPPKWEYDRLAGAVHKSRRLRYHRPDHPVDPVFAVIGRVRYEESNRCQDHSGTFDRSAATAGRHDRCCDVTPSDGGRVSCVTLD
jgi:hypothetical protein